MTTVDRPPARAVVAVERPQAAVDRARRVLLAVAAGLLLFAGHPPLDWGWAGLVALAPLTLLAYELANARRPGLAGAGWGLLAGVVFFGPLLYWIGRFGIVPWALLVLVQAAFVAAYLGGLGLWGRRRWLPLVAVVWWVGLEALRTVWPLGGFPWGALGYSQHSGGLVLPVARYGGVLAVSAVCAALGVCAAVALRRAGPALAGPRPPASGGRAGPDGLVGALRAPLSGAALLLLVCGLAAASPAPTGDGRTLDVAGVQGNDVELPPGMYVEDTGRVEDIAERMAATTRLVTTAPEGPPTLTVWPESSLDADVRDNARLQELVAGTVAELQGGTLVATGVLNGPTPDTFHNAVMQFGPDAELQDVYTKRKLVPFGEYIPARSLVGWYPALRHRTRDGAPGDQPHALRIGDALVGPVTCYESIFPGLVHDQVREGAQLLVVLTNNASYGRSAATHQHLAFSRLRAVETGRWVLHAGISGVSAVIDPQGRSSQETELFEQAVVRADLPLIDGQTPAVRFGQHLGSLALALSAGGLLWVGAERVRGRSRR